MDVFNMEAKERELPGKGANRRLKNEGLVPGILYDQGDGALIALDEHELQNILNKSGEDVFLNLHFKGQNMMTRVKEVQRNPVNQSIQHIDLMPADDYYQH